VGVGDKRNADGREKKGGEGSNGGEEGERGEEAWTLNKTRPAKLGEKDDRIGDRWVTMSTYRKRRRTNRSE